MKIKVLGTGAAEGIPALYCNCRVCQIASRLKGKEIRTRAQLLFNDDLMVDYGPDLLWHKVNYDIDLIKIKTLLITHSHTDHLNPYNLSYRGVYFTTTMNHERMTIVSNAQVKYCFNTNLIYEPIEKGVLDLIDYKVVHAYQKTDVNGYEIYTVHAHHALEEEALNYIIRKGGKTVFVSFDTGWYYDETIRYLKENDIHLDLLLIDGTSGASDINPESCHMALKDEVINVKRLKDAGVVNNNTRIVVTHISHNGGYTHEEYVNAAEEYGYEVAYDGMDIDL